MLHTAAVIISLTFSFFPCRFNVLYLMGHRVPITFKLALAKSASSCNRRRHFARGGHGYLWIEHRRRRTDFALADSIRLYWTTSEKGPIALLSAIIPMERSGTPAIHGAMLESRCRRPHRQLHRLHRGNFWSLLLSEPGTVTRVLSMRISYHY